LGGGSETGEDEAIALLEIDKHHFENRFERLLELHIEKEQDMGIISLPI
jgi:hypothetical protein